MRIAPKACETLWDAAWDGALCRGFWNLCEVFEGPARRFAARDNISSAVLLAGALVMGTEAHTGRSLQPGDHHWYLWHAGCLAAPTIRYLRVTTASSEESVVEASESDLVPCRVHFLATLRMQRQGALGTCWKV